jgi:hypothetical protein
MIFVIFASIWVIGGSCFSVSSKAAGSPDSTSFR